MSQVLCPNDCPQNYWYRYLILIPLSILFTGCTERSPFISMVINNDIVHAQIELERNPKVIYEYDNMLGYPLHIACRYGNKEMVELLLAHNAECNIKMRHYQRATLFNSNVSRIFEEPKARDLVDEETPLCLLLSSKYHFYDQLWRDDNENILNIMKLLIGHGANVNAKGIWGEGPLHFITAYSDGLALADLLIRNGSYIDDPNEFGETPLYKAVEFRNVPIVKVLLENGANPNHPARDNTTPYSISKSGNNNAITLLIDEYLSSKR